MQGFRIQRLRSIVQGQRGSLLLLSAHEILPAPKAEEATDRAVLSKTKGRNEWPVRNPEKDAHTVILKQLKGPKPVVPQFSSGFRVLSALNPKP